MPSIRRRGAYCHFLGHQTSQKAQQLWQHLRAVASRSTRPRPLAESFAVDVSIDDALNAETTTTDAPATPTLEPSATRPLSSEPPASDSAVTSVDSIGTLTRAALAGDTYAQYLLGGRYLNGDGVELDSARGALLVQQAATSGLPSAQYRLGTLFERGEGVPRDPLNAVNWYEKAAVAGEVKAMHNLAVLHAEGTGIPQDFKIAARWFEVAAERGLTDSQFNLGILRQKGLGISKDLVEAYKWFALAAREGDQEAERQRLGRRNTTTAFGAHRGPRPACSMGAFISNHTAGFN